VRWSPQQIAQWPRVSHESIYRDVSMPSRNVFDASMFHRLRTDRPNRRPRGKRCWHGRGRIRNMVCIHERPTRADTREVAGHGG
jgi:IS30 family transposase